MKRLASLAAAGVVLTLTGTGTAAAQTQVRAGQQAHQQQVFAQQAAPRGKTAATHSRLYRTGRLTETHCSPGDIQRGSTAAFKTFLAKVTNCLDRAWAGQFRQAGLPFAKPKVRITTRRVKTACNTWTAPSTGFYCSTDRTIYILVTKRDLREPSPAGKAQLMAHEYGHHVQNLAGIMDYWDRARDRAGKPAALRLTRRLELQADCFGAVFLKTVSHSLPLPPSQWSGMVNWARENGHKGWQQNTHGSGQTQAFWLERGYGSGGPGACDTWSVPSGQVA